VPHRHAIILLALIIAGVIGGVFAGWFLGPAMQRVAWIGTLFLNLLKMMIVPLILAAVISGVASLGDVRKLGRLGAATVVYYMATTAAAVLIGLIMVDLIRPGAGLALAAAHSPAPTPPLHKDMGVGDVLLTLVDPNLVDAAAHTRLLPLILFAILFSAALTTIGERGAHVIAFFDGVNEAMMKLVTWIMYLAPVGIFALVSSRLGQAGGRAFSDQIAAVGWHVVTVLSALAVHLAVLVLIMIFIGGRGLDYLVGMLRALFTAFGTASSSATLPLTMECARENGIDPRSVRFVLPLGSTVNMNGTALYEAAAAMFIAQAYDIDLTLGQQVIVFITATLAAVGAAGVPEAGLVTMLIVLKSVGLPLDGISLLLAVDWFLDRFRTAINVWGDAVGAAVIDRHLPRLLPP
jgi:Na+/H+-dicarboxylate symporter